MFGWVCFSVERHLMGRDSAFDKINDEAEHIFGHDLCEVYCPVISDSHDFRAENYVFVKCIQYTPYVDIIRKSRVFLKALPDVENPSVVSDDYIAKFKESIREYYCPDDLFFGDHVYVESGEMKGMYGIILCMNENDTYTVLFSTFSADEMILEMKAVDLRKEESVYNIIRFPVCSDVC